MMVVVLVLLLSYQEPLDPYLLQLGMVLQSLARLLLRHFGLGEGQEPVLGLQLTLLVQLGWLRDLRQVRVLQFV